MQRRFKVGEVEIIHFYMPGKYLNDSSLIKLHSRLIQIGYESKTLNVSKLLEKNLTTEEIREHLKHTVVAYGMINKVPYGLLIHPINKDKKKPAIESDLFLISKNPGAKINKMMAYGNLIMLYERLGKFASNGSFDLDVANIGTINLLKYFKIIFQFFLLKKELKKVADERDIECETIRQIISMMNSGSDKKCLRC